MNILKYILGSLVALLAILVGVASQQADTLTVSRSTAMVATPAAIFAHVNTLKKWDAWSPWAKLDPHAKNAFEGPEAGVGAKMSWAGNYEVGVGSMTITESVPGERVKFQLDFEKPMKGTSTAEFTFKPVKDGTEVTWSMSGPRDLPAKVMGLIFNCEKMLGGQFEKGLASLKAVAEAK